MLVRCFKHPHTWFSWLFIGIFSNNLYGVGLIDGLNTSVSCSCLSRWLFASRLDHVHLTWYLLTWRYKPMGGLSTWRPFCRSYTSADSRLAPNQWETSLPSNAVSHWLGANLESALYTMSHMIFTWWHHDMEMLSALWPLCTSHWKIPFAKGQWCRTLMLLCFINLSKMLNDLLNWWWFQAPWRSYDLVVLTLCFCCGHICSAYIWCFVYTYSSRVLHRHWGNLMTDAQSPTMYYWQDRRHNFQRIFRIHIGTWLTVAELFDGIWIPGICGLISSTAWLKTTQMASQFY